MGYCGTPGCTRPHCNVMTPPEANRPPWILKDYGSSSSESHYIEFERALEKIEENYNPRKSKNKEIEGKL